MTRLLCTKMAQKIAVPKLSNPFCNQKRLVFQSCRRLLIGSVPNQIENFNKIIKYGRPRLAYTVTPQSEAASPGSPLVILHGMFGSKSNWKSLGNALNKRTSRKVITFDARNHGESEQHISMAYEAMTFDLRKLLEKLGIKKCIIIGHSMGGKTAMCFALTNPELVDRLIVVDSFPGTSVATGAAVQCLKAMMQLNVKAIKSQAEANEALKSGIKDDKIRQFILTNLRISNGSARWTFNLQFFHKNLEYMLGFPHFEDDHFLGQTLFIAGQESDYITEKEIPEIMRLFPTATIEYIEKAGHWVHSDQPVSFLDTVCNFLKS